MVSKIIQLGQEINAGKKMIYHSRYIRWFVREFSYRFWTGHKRSNGPNMTEEEYDKWFQK